MTAVRLDGIKKDGFILITKKLGVWVSLLFIMISMNRDR